MEARQALDKITSLKNETISNLKEKLLKLQQRNATKEEAEKEITGCFQKAFSKIKTEHEKTQLYRKLSLITHPDKIESKESAFDQPIITYLTKEKLCGTPQQILDKFKENNVLDEIKSAPTHWLMRVLGHLLKIAFLKNKIDKHPEINQYKEQLVTEKTSLKNLAPIFGLILAMQENLDRYFQPLKFLTKAINTLILITLFIGIILFAICKGIVSFLIRGCLDLLINIHTWGVFYDKCQAYKNDKFPEMRDKYISKLKDMDIQTADMTEQDFIYFVKQQLIQQGQFIDNGETDFEEKYINIPAEAQITISGTTQLKLIASSFYGILTQPLPEGSINKAVTILAWPFRLLTALPLLFLATVVEFIDSLLNAVLLSAITGAFIGWTSSLFTLNVPLFVWDTPSYLMTGIRNVCTLSSSNPDEALSSSLIAQNRNRNKGTYLMLTGPEGSLSNPAEAEYEAKNPSFTHSKSFGSSPVPSPSNSPLSDKKEKSGVANWSFLREDEIASQDKSTSQNNKNNTCSIL